MMWSEGGFVMSPVWFMGLLACASVAIGLNKEQGLTVTYPLLWQQQENTRQSQERKKEKKR